MIIDSKRFDFKDGHHFTVEMVDIHCSETFFVEGPSNPLRTTAILTRGYEGVYSTEIPSQEEVKLSIQDMRSTKLNTPFEMLEFVFLMVGVPRTFTHQLVRTRVGASFIQESMRFLGHKGVYRVLITQPVMTKGFKQSYFDTVARCIVEYEKEITAGVPSEDARGVLPEHILTSIFFGGSLSTIQRIYAQRMCCQAQPGIWQLVMQDIKKNLENKYSDLVADLLSAPYERGEPCGYRASFDRPCIWKKEKPE
jgi:thymidylate synthase ThyX